MRDWDPKGQPPDDENDDDLNWDWLSDAEQKETGSDRTGLTGQLSWQNEESSTESDESGETPSFDWQNPSKPGSQSSPNATGLTGNLDWQESKPGSSSSRFSETGLTGNLDWQESAADPLPPEPASANTGWDDELGEDSDADTLYTPLNLNLPAQPSTGETDQLLDWMAGSDSDDEIDLPDVSIDDPDDWMQDLEPDIPPVAQQDPSLVEIPDWLVDLEPSDENADTPERTSTGFTGYLEDPYELEPYDQNADDSEAVSEYSDDLSFEEPLDDLSFDGTYDDTPDFDALIGQSETSDDLSTDFDFDTLFTENTGSPAPAASSDEFEGEFDFDSLVAEDASDDLSPDLDFETLFAEDTGTPPVSQAPAQAAPDDLDLDSLFEDSSGVDDDAWLTDFEAEEEPIAEDDFGSFFGDEETSDTDADYMANIVASGRTNEPDDWFAEPAAASLDDDPNWLDSLEDISLDDVIDTSSPVPAQPTSSSRPTTRPAEVDLDAMFADTDDSPMPTRARGYNTFDLNSFAEIPEDEMPQLPLEEAEENLDVPDWLREAAASTDDQLSAAGIIRQKYQDRPLESLDDRLKALREASLNLSSTPVEAPESRRVLQDVLPGVEETLTAGNTVVGSAATLDTALHVTPDQQKNAALLRSLVGNTTPEAEASAARTRARRNLPVLRWLVAAVLLIAVLVPFFVPLSVGKQPDNAFVAGSPGSNAFVRIGTLPPGAFVLVAAEYGPTGASELDPLLRVVLTHILSQNARPILVSTNPVGLRHAENILFDLVGEETKGRAYYILGYQPGALLGLRNLDANSNVLFSADAQGEKLGLTIDSLEDVSLAFIVAENAESVQTWIEQTRIGRNVPVVIASSAAALPLITPYSQQGEVAGLLTGYRDAVTYTTMLAKQAAMTPLRVNVPDRPTQIILPTAIPVTPSAIPPTVVPVITQEATVEATIEATAEATQALLVEATATEEDAEPTIAATPTDEPTVAVPTDTDVPTEQPATATKTATSTPTTTPTATQAAPTGDTIELALINSTSNVNTRSGPATTFDIVRGLTPGTQVRVIDYNDDRSWVQVELSDGETAWIAAFLVKIREVPVNEAETQVPRTQRQRRRQNGRLIAQAETPVFPTVDATLLTVDSDLMLTVQAAQSMALTQAAEFGGTPGLSFTLEPSLLETQSAVLTQAGGLGDSLQLTQAAALTQVSLTLTPGAVGTTDAVLDITSEGTLRDLPTPFIPNTDARWTATTFGLAASLAIIILGNIIAAIGWLRRNR